MAGIPHDQVGSLRLAARASRDLDPTALGHGVGRVEQQVQQHLAQLGWIHGHSSEHRAVGQVHAHLDRAMPVQRRAGPARPRHLKRGEHRLVDVGRRRGRLGSRPRQTLQVAHDARAVERRLADGNDGLARGQRQLVRMQQLDLAEDRRQQVVEVVRHARRHFADCAQLLGVQKLRIQASRLGDVRVNVDTSDHLADRATHRRRIALHDALRLGRQLPFTFVDLRGFGDQLAQARDERVSFPQPGFGGAKDLVLMKANGPLHAEQAQERFVRDAHRPI